MWLGGEGCSVLIKKQVEKHVGLKLKTLLSNKNARNRRDNVFNFIKAQNEQ